MFFFFISTSWKPLVDRQLEYFQPAFRLLLHWSSAIDWGDQQNAIFSSFIFISNLRCFIWKQNLFDETSFHILIFNEWELASFLFLTKQNYFTNRKEKKIDIIITLIIKYGPGFLNIYLCSKIMLNIKMFKLTLKYVEIFISVLWNCNSESYLNVFVIYEGKSKIIRALV